VVLQSRHGPEKEMKGISLQRTYTKVTQRCAITHGRVTQMTHGRNFPYVSIPSISFSSRVSILAQLIKPALVLPDDQTTYQTPKRSTPRSINLQADGKIWTYRERKECWCHWWRLIAYAGLDVSLLIVKRHRKIRSSIEN